MAVLSHRSLSGGGERRLLPWLGPGHSCWRAAEEPGVPGSRGPGHGPVGVGPSRVQPGPLIPAPEPPEQIHVPVSGDGGRPHAGCDAAPPAVSVPAVQTQRQPVPGLVRQPSQNRGLRPHPHSGGPRASVSHRLHLGGGECGGVRAPDRGWDCVCGGGAGVQLRTGGGPQARSLGVWTRAARLRSHPSALGGDG